MQKYCFQVQFKPICTFNFSIEKFYLSKYRGGPGQEGELLLT